MTDLELKQLEEQLWHSADLLRAGAHMSATSYGEPILGLIFLRYADIVLIYAEAQCELNDGISQDAIDALNDILPTEIAVVDAKF